jgi:hypothetical protein
MLKTQLAAALQPPMDTRSEGGLHLLQELDQDPGPDLADGSGVVPAPRPESADRTCDRVIALLRARLAVR